MPTIYFKSVKNQTRYDEKDDKFYETGFVKFHLEIERELQFTDCADKLKVSVLSEVEWLCKKYFLEVFAQEEWIPKLPMVITDGSSFPFWTDAFGNHHETRDLDDFLQNGDITDLISQFLQKYERLILIDTNISFIQQMNIKK